MNIRYFPESEKPVNRVMIRDNVVFNFDLAQNWRADSVEFNDTDKGPTELTIKLKKINVLTEDPVRIKGRWIEHKDYPELAYLCSECNHFTTVKSNYCPNCGASMTKG